MLTWARITRFPDSSATWSKPSGRSASAWMARTRETTLSWAARLRQREEMLPLRAVSGTGTDVACDSGPDQNCAGVTPTTPGGFFH